MLKQQGPKKSLQIASIVILDGRDEAELLALAGSLVRVVDEALGSVILAAIGTASVSPRQVDRFRLTPGKGVAGSVDGHAVIIGSSSYLSDRGIRIGNVEQWAERVTNEKQSVILVAVDSQLAGFLRVSMD